MDVQRLLVGCMGAPDVGLAASQALMQVCVPLAGVYVIVDDADKLGPI
jgi:hypothetical protein